MASSLRFLPFLCLLGTACLVASCTGVVSRTSHKSKEVLAATATKSGGGDVAHHQNHGSYHSGGRLHSRGKEAPPKVRPQPQQQQQHNPVEEDETVIDLPAAAAASRSGDVQQQRLPAATNATERGYIPSNCSRCRMLEETINLTKEAIKQQILSKLGLKQPPNITGRALPRIPPLNHLLDMYGMQSDAPGHNFKPGPEFGEAEDDYHAKTEKVLSFAQTAPEEWGLPPNMEVLYFKFSEPVMDNKVVRTNLWVYLNPSERLLEPNTLVHVYKVCLSPGLMQEHIVTAKVDIKPRKGGWVTVDIRKLVAEWFRNPGGNFGILVQAYDKDGRQLVITNRRADVDQSLMPFLEVYTMDESKRRTKRMIGLNCEERSNEVRCCRYPLTVDFEEFGWDWIIAPKKYEANYCSGECPFVFLQKYPHTHLVQQANPSGSAGPCCAPRKMSPISMLYFDTDFNIIYGLLPGMVVDRCGCS